MSIASEIKFQNKSISFKNEQNIIKRFAQPLDWTIFFIILGDYFFLTMSRKRFLKPCLRTAIKLGAFLKLLEEFFF